MKINVARKVDREIFKRKISSLETHKKNPKHVLAGFQKNPQQ